MATLAILNAVILLPIAVLHVIWALGKTWPFADADALVHTVIGAKNTMPERWHGPVTALVALVVFCAALLPLMLVGILPELLPKGVLQYLACSVAAVFLLRACAGYSGWSARMMPLEPFYSYNRRYYAPLIAVLGVSFLILGT